MPGTNITRLTLGNLSQNADLFLENASGEVIEKSIRQASQAESLTRTLLPGTYYVRVAAQVVGESSYRLSLESRAATANEIRKMYIAADADARRGGAARLGDLTGLQGSRTEDDAINGGDDPIDYYRFSVRAERLVQLTLRGQEANANLFLEDGGGHVLARAETAGAVDEMLSHALKAGTYYVRVAAREAGANSYTLEYSVTAPVQKVIGTLGDLPEGVRGFMTTFIPAKEEDLIAVRHSHGGISEPEDRDYPDDNTTPGEVLSDGGEVTGTTDIGFMDRDRYKVEFTGGTPYLIEAHGVQTGRGYVHQTDIQIYDSSGNRVTSNIVFAGVQLQNRRIIFTPPGSGTATYFISVGGSGGYNPNPPREIAAEDIPPGHSHETVVCVTSCQDDGSPNPNSQVATYYSYPKGTNHGGIYLKIDCGERGCPSGTKYLFFPRGGASLPATYTLTVDLADEDDETVAVGQRHRGYFWDESDTDTITVALVNGKTYRAVLQLGFSATHVVFESIVSDNHSPLSSSQRLLGPRLTDFTFTATQTEEYRFTVSAQSLSLLGRKLSWSGGTYNFRVEEVAAASEASGGDCADAYETTCSLAPGATVNGRIGTSGDKDWYALPGLQAGVHYAFTVTAGDGTDDLTNVQVQFHDRYALPARLGVHGISSAISIRPLQSGTYYLQIASIGMGDSRTGPYTITMTDITSMAQEEEPTPAAQVTETTDCPAATPTCTFDIDDIVDGALDPAGDVDSWLVDLDAGKTYQFDLEGRDGGDGALPDPVIILYDDGGTDVATDTGTSAQFTYAVRTGEGGTYTLDVESGASNTGGYRITVTDITPEGQQSLREETTPLTAEFRNVPAEHDGSSAFDLELHFSEAPRGMSYRTLRSASFFDITNGTVTKAKRLVRKDNSGWRVTVEPDSSGDVTLGLLPALPTADCAEAAVVCTADGTRLSVGPATMVPGPASFSVADAAVQEAPNATLDFVVTLDRARHETTTVAYATSDGTATAGADYTAESGTLTFAIGETEQTVSVPVLDDAIDDDGETVTLTLSTASAPTRITRATATGTIENADPLPQAWLARFGRTVGTHVVDAVGERLRGAPGSGSHLTIGGQRLPLGTRGAATGTPDETPDGAADGASGVARLVQALGQRLGLSPGPASAGSGSTGTDPWAVQPGMDPRLGQSRTLDIGQAFTLRQILLGSSFRLAFGAADADSSQPRLTAWGRFAGTRFDGQDGDLTLDGDVFTGTVGVDGEWDRVLAGVAVAHSRGEGGYTMSGLDTQGRGDLENTLTSIHPYLRYAVTDRLAVWGLLGYGWGELELAQGTGATLETDTTLVMGAVGGRGILLAAADSGGFQLATRTDAMLTRTSSDAVTGMQSSDADAHRLRLVLEGSRAITWAQGRSLTPTLELGVRHDWGDAETGFGVEVGGRIRYTDPTLGLTIEGTVRGLLAHEDAAYEEWGASGNIRLAPGPGGQGLALTLAPTWGAAASGVDGLWSRQTTAGLAPNTSRAPTGRLSAEVGYGVPAPFGTGLLTPYAGTVLTEGAARTWRLGTHLQLNGGPATGLTLNLEGTRQNPAGPQPVNQGLRLQATWAF